MPVSGGNEFKEREGIILLVSDESSPTLHAALEEAGFAPRATSSVKAGILAASHYTPRVIVLEYTFLQERGYHLMETIKMAAPDSSVVVLCDGDEQQRLRSLLLGAEDCIPRPCSMEEIVVRVKRVAERRAGLAQLAEETQSHRRRHHEINQELNRMRRHLRRNLTLLQRAVDLHQRITPRKEAGDGMRDFLSSLGSQLNIDRLAYMTRSHPESSWLSIHSVWGISDSFSSRLRLPTHGGLAEVLRSTAAACPLKPLTQLPDLRHEVGMLIAGGFTAVVPQRTEGTLDGLVLLGRPVAEAGSQSAGVSGEPTEESLQLATFLASSLSPAVAAQELRKKDAHLSVNAIAGLVTRLEAVDPYLSGHSTNVARLAEQLGMRLGMDGDSLSLLTMAGILHDVGRFEVDAALWGKTEPLTDREWELMREHPVHGASMAKEALWPEPVVLAIRHHHERWDGSGYPEQLSGEDIPLNARILGIVDTFEALTSPRPHREALNPHEAMEYLKANAGTKFDPALVDQFSQPASKSSAA